MSIELIDSSIVEYGTLAIGIGTFALAIVLAFINWSNSVRDRKVHLADKQQDWLVEFRHNIAELMALQIAMSTRKYTKLPDGLPDMDEYQQRRFGQLLKLDHLSNNVFFMFDTKDGHYDEIKVNIEICSSLLGNVSAGTLQKMATQHTLLRELIDKIINRQRKKIANLDTENPLI